MRLLEDGPVEQGLDGPHPGHGPDLVDDLRQPVGVAGPDLGDHVGLAGHDRDEDRLRPPGDRRRDLLVAGARHADREVGDRVHVVVRRSDGRHHLHHAVLEEPRQPRADHLAGDADLGGQRLEGGAPVGAQRVDQREVGVGQAHRVTVAARSPFGPPTAPSGPKALPAEPATFVPTLDRAKEGT